MTTKIITFCFYLLFFLTPLLWTPLNFELFEYNKMMFVYLLTIIITGTWILKMVGERKLLIKKTPLDIPLMLFLGANILSTVFSIDRHTSLWGYYSRSNGGLLSLISYLLLYYALVSNFTKNYVPKFLKSALSGGFLVSLWAIPEHFGVSPSCVILTGQATASCWVQDVQARVFATLGQPNWLAAYLAMLIFPALYFFLTAKTSAQKILFYFLLITFYLSFTFTYSRGATIGLIAGLAVFLSFWLVQNRSYLTRFLSHRFALPQNDKSHIKSFLIVITSFLLINLLFGSALTDFKLLSKFTPPPRPALTLPSGELAPSSSTQLETGGTESGQIRLIVWKGALEIFKHFPIFGSGVETFAYSYYNYRPTEHNNVSEWDFLYNKAHNEFLNYLATTGLVGFLSYLGIIITFILWCIKYYVLSIKQKKGILHNTYYIILIPSLLASYISNLVQNLFGFSVVIIALYFYLFPALAFLSTDAVYEFKIPKQLSAIRHLLPALIYRRPFFTKLTKGIVVILTLVFIFTIAKFWIADTQFASGENHSSSGNSGRAYNDLIDAVSLNPNEPFYRSELGYAAAEASISLAEEDATLSAQLKSLSLRETNQALSISPRNVSFWRTAIRTFFALSTYDPDFNKITIDTVDTTITLAPTDPKLYYNKGLILGQMDKNQEASQALEKAVELKGDYREARLSLSDVYVAQKEEEKAKEQLKIVLEQIPNDPDALSRLEGMK